MTITIKKVSSSRDLKHFIDFPHLLYKEDRNYVPELFIAQKDLLTPQKHPFFAHSKLDLFLAFQNSNIVGRIAAIRNNNHIAFTGNQEGFFGFFDVIEDFKVAEKLFDTARNWVKNEGLNSIIGPTNFSTNETCGMLVDGFNYTPFAMMSYNKAYYPSFLLQYGFSKKIDLIAYYLTTDKVSEKALRLEDKIEERLKKKEIIIRQINMKKFDEEIEKVKSIYNSAWEKNWGFVPMTDKEFIYLAKDMKMIIDPEYCLIAEHQGKAIGFSLAIPDMNQIFIKIKKGRLFPFGILKILINKNKIDKIRIITLGVMVNYRKQGIEACFYAKTIMTSRKKKIMGAEASWILENNEMMNNAMLNINGEPYKKYRIYEMAL